MSGDCGRLRCPKRHFWVDGQWGHDPAPPPAATPSPEPAALVVCRCDGGAYRIVKHPFIVHPECRIHAKDCNELPTPAPGASGETREAAQRVAHFVAEWKKHRGHDPEQVHGLNAGTDREAVLLASDLLTLAALAPGPDTTTVVGNPMIAMIGPGQASYALLPEPDTARDGERP